MNEKHLLFLTLSAVVFGISIGLLFRQFQISDEVQTLIAFPGEIFMQVLKLMILPLIFSSLISSLGQMKSNSGKMGRIALCYYLTTMIIASIIGVIIVLTIHPGDPSVKNLDSLDQVKNQSKLSALDSLLDLIRNMFPENIIEATMKRSQTIIKDVKKHIHGKNSTNNVQIIEKKSVELRNGTNILGIIVFCSGFGIIISTLGEKGRIVVEFFIIIDKVIMKFVSILMLFSPFGIVSLICSSILEIDDISKMATTMTLYVVTVMLCLLCHCIIAIPILYLCLTRKNPWNVAKGMLQPFVTAVGTASSGASLPQAIESVETNLKIDPRIAGFIMPLGNTINMDGNALYEAVAVIFIAQLNDFSLKIADVITICVTATFASIGMNAVPAGLVSMFVILSTVGLPVTDISLLFTVDWFIDRIRTALNVVGDAYCASVVQHFLENDLELERRYSIEPLSQSEIERGILVEPSAHIENNIVQQRHVTFSLQSPNVSSFNETKTYSLKSAIIQPLRAHVSLQTRLSQLSEE